MSLFNWVINASIASTIVIGLILVVRGILRKHLNPRVITILWFVVILKIFIPNGPSSGVSLFNVFNEGNLRNYEIAVEDYEEIQVTTELEEVNVSNDNGKKSINISKFLFYIWIIGGSFQGVRFLFSYKYIKAICRRSDKSPEWIKIIGSEVKEELGIKGKINIVISEKVHSPALFGYNRVNILIPRGMIRENTREEIRCILYHELIHYKYKDNLVKGISNIVRIIHWFNPVIILAMREMERDLEIACDYCVMKYCNSLVYGSTLIKFAERITFKSTSLVINSLIRENKDLKERIRMISNNKKYGKKGFIVGVVSIIIVFILCITTKSPMNNIVANGAENKVNDGKVVLYATHSNEDYDNGYSINNVVSDISSNLNTLGVTSSVISLDEKVEYTEAYNRSREGITNNVKDLDGKLLIDIHRETSTEKTNGRTVVISLATKGERYEKNKEVASKLASLLEKNGVKALVYEYVGDGHKFNLDLSDNALSIAVGNSSMSKEDLKYCTEVLAKGIKEL